VSIEFLKEESASAVSSLTTITASATATGFGEIAKESNKATSIIVNYIYPAPSIDAVAESRLTALEASMGRLGAQLVQRDRSQVQRCMDEFAANRKKAKSKQERFHAAGIYALCLMTCFVSVKV